MDETSNPNDKSLLPELLDDDLLNIFRRGIARGAQEFQEILSKQTIARTKRNLSYLMRMVMTSQWMKELENNHDVKKDVRHGNKKNLFHITVDDRILIHFQKLNSQESPTRTPRSTRKPIQHDQQMELFDLEEYPDTTKAMWEYEIRLVGCYTTDFAGMINWFAFRLYEGSDYIKEYPLDLDPAEALTGVSVPQPPVKPRFTPKRNVSSDEQSAEA
jgi:hypothetical protein